MRKVYVDNVTKMQTVTETYLQHLCLTGAPKKLLLRPRQARGQTGPKMDCWVYFEKVTFRRKMEIVSEFGETFHNNNDKPFKSSRILRGKPKTLEILEGSACFHSSFFTLIIFLFSCMLLFWGLIFLMFVPFEMFSLSFFLLFAQHV